jgi:ferritin-like protein
VKTLEKVDELPKEIFDADEFLALAAKADVCRVKKLGEYTKLKLRTGRYLYTIKLAASEAEGLLSRISCSKEEI